MRNRELNRSYRAGEKISNNILTLLFLGGLWGITSLARKSRKPKNVYIPLTDYERQEIDELILSLSKPFNFTKTIILYSFLYLFAIASPIVGVCLYVNNGIWMFLCVLVLGFAEFVFNFPSYELDLKIKFDWVLSEIDKEKQLKQIKTLAWLAVVVNIILLGLNSYPFIVSYEEGVLVTIMTIVLYLVNVSSIVMNVKMIKNLNALFEQNIAKFSSRKLSNDINKEQSQNCSIYNNDVVCNDVDKINLYLDRCNNKNLQLAIIKANIRISNAIIECYRKGYLKLTYKIVKQQLEEKIEFAKRDFVKRECRLAIEITRLLKENEIDKVIEILDEKYQI